MNDANQKCGSWRVECICGHETYADETADQVLCVLCARTWLRPMSDLARLDLLEGAKKEAAKLAYGALTWHPGNEGPRWDSSVPETICRVCGYRFESDSPTCPGSILRAMGALEP